MKHSVVLSHDRCRGCTTCIKTCPTEAIRVRRGKATILDDRCIDCGRCIQVCPHRAIRAVTDPMDRLRDFRYCVAIPEPALYGQFHHLWNVDLVLNGLLKIGFDQVYESARASELLAAYINKRGAQADRPAPIIASNCPAVLRLIRIRFPRLIGNIDPLVLPMELGASVARREAAERTGLKPEEIGVFAIVPCAAKATSCQQSEGLEEPVLDGAFSIRDVYMRLLPVLKELGDDLLPLNRSGAAGFGTAVASGECHARGSKRFLAVDGIDNVIQMLEEIEDGRQSDVDLIELSSCTQGCVGGCLNVENPYTARMRIRRMMRDMLEAVPRRAACAGAKDLNADDERDLQFDRTLEVSPALLLDEDRAVAMQKHLKIEALEGHLPGLHCGSCGAPNCHAFAEDVIQGRASLDDCIFRVRERMRGVAGPNGPDDYLPPPFRQQEKPDKGSGE